MTNIKSYNELIKLPTLIDRFEYLKTCNVVGDETFGSHRHLNQVLYNSIKWKEIRRHIILRDKGCELGIKDYPIRGHIIVHHINPITENDILTHSEKIFDENNLISCSLDLHNAIHYKNSAVLDQLYFNVYEERYPNDTVPWR